MSGPYDDIIHLPHYLSPTRPRMSIANRAAQFAPFAALTGHDAAIRETARLTQERIALDENAVAALDRKLRVLADSVARHPQVAVTYFQEDAKKAGGAYVTAVGALRKLDPHRRVLHLMDGDEIAFADILEIGSELLGDDL